MSRTTSREVERKILRHLHGQKTRSKLNEIHAYFLRHNLHQSNQVLSHFISVCRAHNKMTYAELVFQHAKYPNIFLYNSMIKAYSICGPFEKSLPLFSLMKNRGVWPDEYTFAPLIKSCSDLSDLRLGQCVHSEITKLGFEYYISVRIGIVELYVNGRRMEDAKKVFDEMLTRDVIVWNLMIKGFGKIGNVDMGLYLFRQMSERTVVSWNCMISSLTDNGRDKEAVDLFQEMQISGIESDEATVVTMLPACARLGAYDIGKGICSYAKSTNLFCDFVTVGNAMVTFYSKCGDIKTALETFQEIPNKNVVSWNTIISGLAFNGSCELGVDFFDKMISSGLKPNDSTFVSALTCCAHARLVQKGRELFDSMKSEYQLEPGLEHYGCMADLLGRVGCLRKAYDLIKSMPMSPSATLWGSLLSAARTHNDVEFAELAVKELISIEPWNSGNYILLSNIYAEGGRWAEVEKVRIFMKERGITKSAGQSMVG